MQEDILLSGIPLIKVSTTDVLNVDFMLMHITGMEYRNLTTLKASDLKNIKSGKYYYSIAPEIDNYALLYEDLEYKKSSLVIINPEESNELLYNAGMLQVTRDMAIEYIIKNTNLFNEEEVQEYATVLNGLSLRSMIDAIRITETRFKTISHKTLGIVRRSFPCDTKGLYPVNLDYAHYIPDRDLKLWTKLQGKVFLHEGVLPQLLPRGLLLQGLPGIGKSMGAKYIARTLGLALYRLDLGSMLDKYVGSSEENLENALMYIDRTEPSVLLIDEVEKVFNNKEDNPVMPRLLSALLWWLQEHTSRILTIMTTNDITILPPELYRTGRIDQVITMNPLKDKEEVDAYIHSFVYSMKKELKITEAVVKLISNRSSSVVSKMELDHGISHSDVTEIVKKVLQKYIIKEIK